MKISAMLPSTVTCELIDLADKAAENERRVIHTFVTGQLPIDPIPRSVLRDMLASLPQDEQQRVLYVARRLVNVGQVEYGAIDPKRDGRDYTVEVLEELVDAYVYLAADLIRTGKPHPLFADIMDLMRRCQGMVMRLESV